MNVSKKIMVQGTTTDAGKSTLVAAMCRSLFRKGVKVAPFKPQNMALNSAVTIDGGEIGRAQAVQAMAAGIQPHSDMNPVLLKPNSDTGAQVIIHGKVLQDQDAKDFHAFKPTAMKAVLESWHRLAQQYECIVVEGAGSPAEINLREGDIANMGFAEAVDCPVILVADIDRGGVFAHIIGTLALLSQTERERIVGFVINRFRGDIGLLKPGLDWLEQQTGKPVLGVIPYIHDLFIEAEDSVPKAHFSKPDRHKLRVIAPILPHISNHTDFDALRLHPQVEFDFVRLSEDLPVADLIVLPGSKNVRRDLQHLYDHGWQHILTKHLRYNGKVLGLCGGFQMLGNQIHDPYGIEGEPGSTQGFGWLNVETTMEKQKRLARVQGRLAFADADVKGYEIHMGVAQGAGLAKPAMMIDGQPEGAISDDGQIIGTHLHGVFDHPEATNAWLKWAGLGEETIIFDYFALREKSMDILADTIEKHMDWSKLAKYLA